MRHADNAEAVAEGSRWDSQHPVDIVEDERQWRLRRPDSDPGASAPRVIATRWRALEEQAREVSSHGAEDCHVVKIILRSVNLRLSVSGRTVHDGTAVPGMLHVTEPAAPARCIFRGPHDTLHLHVPDRLIVECVGDRPGDRVPALQSEAVLTPDPITERLGQMLLRAEEMDISLRRMYADSISIAIVVRLLAASQRVAAIGRPRVSGLVTWRLKRAIDYIEARLAEPVALADVASAVGLTRMHFAAQFKAATGLRPHEYLLRRRIERAQEMLARPAMSVVDVALSVGFETQSHFTTVFKRFVGLPPHAWRQAQGRSA